MRNFWGRVLDFFHWTVDISPRPPEKCVICVAPHTSNWDFILGIFAYYSIGRKANFLMKEAWFFFPLKYLLKAMGGIPVPKVRGTALTDDIIARFNSSSYLNLAVTPEGTRSRTDFWRKGFLYIAQGASVPIMLGIIDYSGKRIIIRDSFTPSGDAASDLEKVKYFYSAYRNAAKYPDKFSIE